jgi:predicted choloylglycine hydrolase
MRASGQMAAPTRPRGCTAGIVKAMPMQKYDVHLTRSETERWKEVITCEREATRSLFEAALPLIKEQLPWSIRLLASPLSAIFGLIYNGSGGLYQKEIEVWARAMKIRSGLATVLNCAYEFSYLDPAYKTGCTAAVTRLPNLGLVHLRNLDWSIPRLGSGTRVFHFHGREHCFATVGIIGFVGALSGMVPKQYSVTINWAPPDPDYALGLSAFRRFGAAFLLRKTLETCDTADKAIDFLKTEPLATSAFFTVCDVQDGRALVIERMARGAAVSRDSNLPLVQANHFGTEKFQRANEILKRATADEMSEYQCSEDRMQKLSRLLKSLPNVATLDDATSLLDQAPVLNLDTCQQMVFAPQEGHILARGVEVQPDGSCEASPSSRDGWFRSTLTCEFGRCRAAN